MILHASESTLLVRDVSDIYNTVLRHVNNVKLYIMPLSLSI